MIVGFAWPVYPSTKSLCAMIVARNPLDRFASPDRGAVVNLRGILYSGAPGVYVLQVDCPRDSPRVALLVSRFALAGPATRRTLRSLTRERGAPVHIIARIESEILSDFGYGMILRAWAISAAEEHP